MNPLPLVTIVIDNYNYGRYLGDAVTSALDQTWAPVEVIVVDDGSTDDSCEVLEAFADRIRVIRKTNGGQGSAFNAGFAESKGEIVCFVDADDAVHRDAMAHVVERFTAGDPARPETRPTKVHWRLEVVDAHGRPLGRRFPDGDLLEGHLRERAIAEGPLYDSHTLPPTSGNAWSREFLSRVLPMPERDWDHGADVYLHALAPIYGELRAIDLVLGSYRAHGANHYWKSPLSPYKVDEYLRRFDAASAALADHLKRQGVPATNAIRWRETSYNWQWLDRLQRARADIVANVPTGAAVVLIDNAEWGEAEPLAAHRFIPFPEEYGHWAGTPASDAHAVVEARRQVAAGARFFAFWWTAFWWLDTYPGLRGFLEDRGVCRISGEHLALFEIVRNETKQRSEEQ